MPSKKKEVESFQELVDTTNAEIEQLKNLTGKDFKKKVVEILQGLVESTTGGIEFGIEQRNIIIETFTKAIQNIDMAFEKFAKFQEKIENFRYFLLIHTAQTDYMFKKLVEQGIIQEHTKELHDMIWDEDHVSIIGFDQKPEEVRNEFLKNWEEAGKRASNKKSSKIVPFPDGGKNPE